MPELKYKKGQVWNKAKTAKMIEFEKETDKNAVYNNKITGQFEYWLWQKEKIDTYLEKEQKSRQKAKENLLKLRLTRIKLSRRFKLNDVELYIMEILYTKNKQLSESQIKGEFYVGVKGFIKVKPIRTELKQLVDRDYIKRNDKGKYYLTKEGKSNIKKLLTKQKKAKIAKKIRLEKEAIEKDKRTIEEYKKALPKLKKKSEKAKEDMIKLSKLIPEEARKKRLSDGILYKKENPVMYHRIDKKDELYSEMANANNEWYRKRDAIKRLEDKLNKK